MKDKINREIQKSPQPYFRSGIEFLSDLELSKTTQDNLDKLSDYRCSLLTLDNVQKDLDFFSKKAMKSIWG